MTYRTMRMYQNSDKPDDAIDDALTLTEAQAQCSDPETSSSTCTSAEGIERTERYGAWFVGYESE